MENDKIIRKMIYEFRKNSVATMRQKMRILFHTIIFTFHMVSLLEMLRMDVNKMKNTSTEYLINYAPLFLSGWSFTCQIIFVILAFACDIVKIKTQKQPKSGRYYDVMKKVATARDFMFTRAVVPFGLFVNVAFWTVFLTDRNNVMPEEWDCFITPFINHSMHTITTLIIVMEIIVAKKNFPEGHRSVLKLIGIVNVVYNICLLVVYLIDGRWLYILYENLTWPQRLLVTGINYISTNLFYFLGYYLSKIIENMWRVQEKNAVLVKPHDYMKVD